MTRHRSPSGHLRVVQPMLPLGHADVCWERLPATVQTEVLARWSEMLHEVMRASVEIAADVDEAKS